jgi:hypothetical protein
MPLAIVATLVSASMADAATCLPSPAAVRKQQPKAWPQWTRGPEGKRCWFAGKRPVFARSAARPKPARQPAPKTKREWDFRTMTRSGSSHGRWSIGGHRPPATGAERSCNSSPDSHLRPYKTHKSRAVEKKSRNQDTCWPCVLSWPHWHFLGSEHMIGLCGPPESPGKAAGAPAGEPGSAGRISGLSSAIAACASLA